VGAHFFGGVYTTIVAEEGPKTLFTASRPMCVGLFVLTQEENM